MEHTEGTRETSCHLAKSGRPREQLHDRVTQTKPRGCKAPNSLHPKPRDMTYTAATDQQLKAEMAIRFKAIKMGATCTQVNLWTLNEVLMFISNHA